MDRSFTSHAALLSPHTSLCKPSDWGWSQALLLQGTWVLERNICCRLHGCLLLFLFRLPKMNGRWWSRCMTGIAWSNRSSPEPTPFLLLWVEHSFVGYFFGFELSWGSRNHHTSVYNTITEVTSQPPLSLGDQGNEWINDTLHTEIGQSWLRDFSAHLWAMGHISPCIVSSLSIGLLLFHPSSGYSLTSFSTPTHAEL